MGEIKNILNLNTIQTKEKKSLDKDDDNTPPTSGGGTGDSTFGVTHQEYRKKVIDGEI